MVQSSADLQDFQNSSRFTLYQETRTRILIAGRTTYGARSTLIKPYESFGTARTPCLKNQTAKAKLLQDSPPLGLAFHRSCRSRGGYCLGYCLGAVNARKRQRSHLIFLSIEFEYSHRHTHSQGGTGAGSPHKPCTTSRRTSSFFTLPLPPSQKIRNSCLKLSC